MHTKLGSVILLHYSNYIGVKFAVIKQLIEENLLSAGVYT